MRLFLLLLRLLRFDLWGVKLDERLSRHLSFGVSIDLRALVEGHYPVRCGKSCSQFRHWHAGVLHEQLQVGGRPTQQRVG